jgi:hypothetical protein
MTSDLPIVACSWLFKTALRGAATGVGSLGRLGVVLITGFSGSVVGLDWGFVFVVLAGFHIASTSFQWFQLGSAQQPVSPSADHLSFTQG